jgi:hypothetical protein
MGYKFNQNMAKQPKEKINKERAKILFINALTRLFVFVFCYFVSLFADTEIRKNIP